MTSLTHSTHTQQLLDRWQQGDPQAKEALLARTLERVRMLSRKMFRRHIDLHALDETDDVVQKTLLRLLRALEEVRPVTVLAYFALAARHVRWVLHDLARQRHSARHLSYASDVPGANSAEDGPLDPGGEPVDLLAWSRFHECIGALPDEERETFDLLLYEGLTQAEAAALLGVSVRTIKRRWQRARLLLHEAMRGDWPGPL